LRWRFEIKRQQANSRDASVTPTPTTTISTPSGRCSYLAVQTSRESSIVFATADVSLRYPNPFRRSLQYEISALAESLQFVCAPIARWSIAQPLSNCYAPVANSALDQRCGRQSDALRALSTASFTGLGMSVSLPLFV
jgi:hypothetical protein